MIYTATVNSTLNFTQEQALDTEIANAVSTIGFSVSVPVAGSQTCLVESDFAFETEIALAINPTDSISNGITFNHFVNVDFYRDGKSYKHCVDYGYPAGDVSFAVVGDLTNDVTVKITDKNTELEVESGAVFNHTLNKIPNHYTASAGYSTYTYQTSQLTEDEKDNLVEFFETTIGLMLQHIDLNGSIYLGYITSYPLTVTEIDNNLYEMTIVFFGVGQ